MKKSEGEREGDINKNICGSDQNLIKIDICQIDIAFSYLADLQIEHFKVEKYKEYLWIRLKLTHVTLPQQSPSLIKFVFMLYECKHKRNQHVQENNQWL